MDFSKIKAAASNSKFSNLLNAIDRSSIGAKTERTKDESYWNLAIDDKGVGKAIIRFLPGLKSEGEPCYIEFKKHAYKNPVTGKWFIEPCPNTIKKTCPVCINLFERVTNAGGWDLCSKTEKEYYSLRKSKKKYIANILVISDPSNAENEGKIFKYRFNKSILDKIIAKLSPEFEDETPVNVFDTESGCNFRLVTRMKEDYLNFDLCQFEQSYALDKKIINRLEKEQYPLLSLIAEDQFRSDEEIIANFNRVEGTGTVKKSESNPSPKQNNHNEDDFSSDNSSDDDYFAKLAESIE